MCKIKYIISIYVVLTVLIIYKYYSNKQKHIFWDTQKVSRNGKVINNTNTTSSIVKLQNEFKWSTFTMNKEVYNFILKNYIHDEQYTFERLKWILNPPIINPMITNKFNIMIALNPDSNYTYYQDNIIGTIVGKVINIFIYNEVKQCVYVDFLCIHKLYRNKRLSPLLISKMIEKVAENNIEFTIFKIDKKALPFDYIGKYTYYYYDFDNIPKINNDSIYSNIIRDIYDETTPDKTIQKLYNFYNNHIQNNNYKLYQILTLTEFKYQFTSKPNLIYSSYYKYNNNIIAFTSAINVQYNNNDIHDTRNSIELRYLITNTEHIISIMTLLLKIFYELKFKYLVALDIMNNDIFITKFKFIQGYSTYYQLQNYHAKNITNTENGMNFI
jgi:glycylpeptide N-tetradecanoyltransferase